MNKNLLKNWNDLAHENIMGIFAQTPLPLSVTSGSEHRFIFANQKYIDLFFPGEEIVGKLVTEVAPESIAQGYLALMDQVFQSGQTYQGSETALELRRANGLSKKYILNFTYQPVRDESGQITGIMTVATDITKEVEAREKFDNQKKWLYSVLDRMPTALVLLNPSNSQITFSNLAANEMFGFSLQSTLPHERYTEEIKIYAKQGPALQLSEIPSARLMRGEELKDEEIYLEAKSGHFHLLLNSQLVPGSYGHDETVLLLLKDITAVRAAEEQFTLFAELAPQMPFIADAEGNITYFSRSWYEYIGFKKAMGGWEWKDMPIHHPDDLQRSVERWTHSLRTGEPYEIEYRLRRADGVYRWHLGRASAVRDQSGKISKWFGTNVDIHEQKMLAERLSYAVEVADLGFWEYDIDTSLVTWNEQLRAHFGFEPGSFHSPVEKVFEKIDPRDIFRVQQALSAAIDKSERYDIEFRVVHGNGVIVWLRCQGELVADPQGKPLRMTGTSLNITNHKRSQEVVSESETRFRFLANSMPQIVWTARQDGVLNYINQRWTEYSGSVDPEAWLDYVHPEDRDAAVERWITCVVTGTPYETEFRLRRLADQSYRWHLVRAVMVQGDYNFNTRWYGTCTDVTEQKTLLAELSRAKNEAEIANYTKSAFLANMSHEIRTPLAAILGFSELLEEASLNQEEQKYLEIIKKSGQALTRLIDDILDLSKVEAGQVAIEHQEFLLPHLLREVMDLFQEKARAKSIYLRSDLDDSCQQKIISDPIRIRQILINLIGNAVKFTEKGGVQVRVRGEDVSAQKQKIRIEVQDTGIGMSREQSERLFQPFVQADNSTSRKFGGTGLGLTLSRRLASALHGNVFIERCELGQGCVFVFDLEVEKTQQTVTPASAEGDMIHQRNNLRGKRVLVVDDSPDNRELMEHFLSKQGASFQMAENGLEAVEQALSQEFDIILMDIQMPKMDGYGALAELQKAHYSKPVVALTAHAMLEERKKALSLGFVDHVSKPVNYQLLVETILKYT